MDTKIWKIALTGGPCAGKTTALAAITTYFGEQGFDVICLPEAATLVLNTGFSLKDFTETQRVEFQHSVLDVLISLEDSAFRLAKTKQRPLIICDRGAPDGAAFCAPTSWEEVMERCKTNMPALRDARYDGVVHLVTAADGASEYYGLENNLARNGTAEDAFASDKRLQEVWMGHPHFHIVGNESGFHGKITGVLQSIENIVGVQSGERQDREIIPLDLESVPVPVQTFPVLYQHLPLPENWEMSRLTKRGARQQAVYYHTTVRRLQDGTPLRTDRLLDCREYDALLLGGVVSQEEKLRHCFTWENRYFRVDVSGGHWDLHWSGGEVPGFVHFRN